MAEENRVLVGDGAVAVREVRQTPQALSATTTSGGPGFGITSSANSAGCPLN